MHGLDLNALEIFRTVVAEGGVSRAAARLNRVQSNVSTRIRQLEDRLGTPLFVRQGRGLTLTPDGHLLLGYADRLLRLSEEAADALASDRPRGVLRLGAMESTAAARLPDILARYHDAHPDVDMVLETGTAAAVLERLRGHEVEAALVAEPIPFRDLEARPVFTESLVLVAPEDYPPLDDPRALDGRTVIAFEDGCAYRAHLEGWLRDGGVRPGGFMAVSSYLAIFACVAAGTGYAVVPASVLAMVAAKGRFRRHPLPGPLAAIRTLLVWRAGPLSPGLEALRDLMPALPTP